MSDYEDDTTDKPTIEPTPSHNGYVRLALTFAGPSSSPAEAVTVVSKVMMSNALTHLNPEGAYKLLMIDVMHAVKRDVEQAFAQGYVKTRTGQKLFPPR